MKTPKKEEIIKYFERADIFKSALSGGEYKMDNFDLESVFESNGSFYIMPKNKEGANKSLWDSEKGYAKILSYKEKTYSITESQIKELSETWGNDNSTRLRSGLTQKLKELFPDVLKTELEYGKWIVDDCAPNWIMFFVSPTERYGIADKGNWHEDKDNDNISHCLNMKGNRYATEQEVTEALTKEAVKRGFKEGVWFYGLYGNGKRYNNLNKINNNHSNFFMFDGNLCIGDKDDYFRIFVNGIWSEIINVKEMNQSQIEKELGYKIKIID